MSATIDVDYYEVLEIQETASSIEIKRAFRRLSLVRHPDKDPNNPKAHVAFCTLREAYETLSNDSKRILYNVQYVRIKANRKAFQEQQEQVRVRQAQEKAKQDNAEILRKLESENSASNIKRLAEEKAEKERLAQIQKDLNLTRSQLKAVEEESKARMRAANSGIGLWGYLASWTKSNEQVEKEKTEREQEHLQMLAKERIQTRDLERKIEQLESSKKAQQVTMQQSKKRDDQRQERFWQTHAAHQAAAAAAKASAEAEAKRTAEQKRAREAAEREKATREMFAAMQREQEERQRAAQQRAREERQRAMEEAAERARQKAAAAEKAAREKAEREKAAREKEAQDLEALLARIRAQVDIHRAAREETSWAKTSFDAPKVAEDVEASRRRQTANAAPKRKRKTRSSGAQGEGNCVHVGFWPKVEGKHRCAVCSHDFYLFAYQCPHCAMMACASCRKQLKSGGGKG